VKIAGFDVVAQKTPYERGGGYVRDARLTGPEEQAAAGNDRPEVRRQPARARPARHALL